MKQYRFTARIGNWSIEVTIQEWIVVLIFVAIGLAIYGFINDRFSK